MLENHALKYVMQLKFSKLAARTVVEIKHKDELGQDPV